MRKKKALIVDTNTLKLGKAKVERQNPDPDMLYDLKQIPVSEARINRLCDSLENWFKNNPDAKEIQDFYYEEGIPESTYYKILHRSPRLKELHEMTKHRLGGRLWSKAVDFKANWAPVRFLMQNYGYQYAAAKEYEEMLSKKYETSNGPQIVVIEKFPNSEVVPHKEKA
jgi:hypothetical protein